MLKQVDGHVDIVFELPRVPDRAIAPPPSGVIVCRKDYGKVVQICAEAVPDAVSICVGVEDGRTVLRLKALLFSDGRDALTESIERLHRELELVCDAPVTKWEVAYSAPDEAACA